MSRASRYQLKLETSYRYDEPVPFAKHMLRLQPERSVTQRVLRESLDIEPMPAERYGDLDFFGNRVVALTMDAPHDRLAIAMRAVVEIEPAIPRAPADSPDWREVRQWALAAPDLSARSPVHFLMPGYNTRADREIRLFTEHSFAPGRPIIEAAFDLACRIQAHFQYQSGQTTVATTAIEAMGLRKGVCQDFAHVMIAGLRSIGLPAAYVSGMIRTLPPEGQPRLEGADAMHAWVSVWGGEAIGWIDMDPTNALVVADEHIRFAIGREYADVPPIEGVIVAAGAHRHELGVDVIALD